MVIYLGLFKKSITEPIVTPVTKPIAINCIEFEEFWANAYPNATPIAEPIPIPKLEFGLFIRFIV